MGLIQAVSGSIGGMLADQWKDFYTVPSGLPGTAALFAAVPQGTNAGQQYFRQFSAPQTRSYLFGLRSMF